MTLLRREMQRAHDSSASMWVTEIGWGSEEGGNPLNRGSAGQASSLSQAYSWFLKKRGRLHLKVVVWFTWQDSRQAPSASGAGAPALRYRLLPEAVVDGDDEVHRRQLSRRPARRPPPPSAPVRGLGPQRVPMAPGQGYGGRPSLSIELPAEPRSVAAARHAAAGVAERLGCDVFAVKLAVSELVTNAATHAYTGIDAGPIVVLARSIRGRLVITVADRGRGMTIRPDSPGLGMDSPWSARSPTTSGSNPTTTGSPSRPPSTAPPPALASPTTAAPKRS